MRAAPVKLPPQEGRSGYRAIEAISAVSVALFLVLTAPAHAAADCVTSLANCTMACDQRLKIGDPQRPQCAQACIGKYQSCTRIELLQQNRTKVGPGVLEAPAQ